LLRVLYLIGKNGTEREDKTMFITEINGDTYSDKVQHRIDKYIPKASPITLRTLTSLVDYLKSDKDKHDDLFIVVNSPTQIVVYSKLDCNRDRENVIIVQSKVPSFNFGHFIGKEEFCIGMQSKFIPNDDREIILKFAGTVESGTVAEYGDNGVTQKATIKTGIASKSDTIVPSPVVLRPYRTFPEVEQPESAFIFRMRDQGGVFCALLEADGGAWEIEAMQNIKTYLKEEFKTYPRITVLA
jgi:hypothetical protein